jgi:hypothetical protein
MLIEGGDQVKVVDFGLTLEAENGDFSASSEVILFIKFIII